MKPPSETFFGTYAAGTYEGVLLYSLKECEGALLVQKGNRPGIQNFPHFTDLFGDCGRYAHLTVIGLQGGAIGDRSVCQVCCDQGKRLSTWFLWHLGQPQLSQ